MKTIGKIIKDSRLTKKYSLAKVEEATKIKRGFIIAIEKEDWSALPEFPVTSGFVKSIASFLGLNPESTVAFLRRDYPPKTLRINPKPDVSKNFIWGPKLTFITGLSLTILVLLGYLVFQYLNFVKAPSLNVFSPKENEEITERKIVVRGKTTSDAIVSVNNQPVIVSDEGDFTTEIEVSEKTQELIFIAKSRAGKETTLSRKIQVKL